MPCARRHGVTTQQAKIWAISKTAHIRRRSGLTAGFHRIPGEEIRLGFEPCGLADALDKTQSGRIRVKADDGETETYLPNVRLVNGSTKPAARQSLMQTFNSPFFPEVLVASAVMSEG